MLGSQVLELGPFNIPVWLIAALVGYVFSVVVPRLLFKDNRELLTLVHDALSNGVIAGFATWKLTPVVTRFSEITSSPLRLLYYPGGLPGLIAGLVAGVAVAVVVALRRKKSVEVFSLSRSLRIAAAVIAFIIIPVVVVMLVPSERNAADEPVVTSELLSEAGGRPVVLVFWATWCGPCTAQMPEVERFYNRNSADIGLFAVNLTATEGSEEIVENYVIGNGYTMPVVYDPRDTLRAEFNVRATPTTLILDRDGNEQFRRIGAVTAAWIERRVLPLR